MATIYAILAHSASRNQTQRIMDQDSLQGRHTTDRRLAEQKAAAFAGDLNKRRKLGVTDWTPRIEAVEQQT